MGLFVRFICICLSFSIFVNAAPIESVMTNKKLTRSMCEILEILGYEGSYDLEDVFAYTQKNWLQYPKERWHFDNPFEGQKEKILPLLQKANCVDSINAKEELYEYAIIYGGTLPIARNRLAHLIKQWENGVRFAHIIFFSGERKLEPSFEGEKHLLDTENNTLAVSKDWVCPEKLPENEVEMMQFVYNQAEKPLEMQKIPVRYLSAKKLYKPYFSQSRPNTADTILQWIQEAPKNGKILCVSSQPYIWYQDAVMRYFLYDHNFYIETIGNSSLETPKVSVYLDTLTKWLYWERQIFKKASE